MIFLQANNDPNIVAERFLDGLMHCQYQLGLDKSKELDATLAKISAFVRTRINAFAGINTLPTELLSLIFLQTIPSPDAYLHPNVKRRRVWDDIKHRNVLTHVCSRWRTVALDLSSLWDVIVDSSSTAAPAFLTRAKAVPLHAHLTYTPNRSIRTHLIQHSARIRYLSLTIPEPDRSVIPLKDPFPFPAPHVECLSLTTLSAPYDDGRPPIDLAAPQRLFPPTNGNDQDEGLPRLRRLVLRNMCWLPAAPYAQLTHLFLTEGSSLPLPALLDLLRRCPALEALALVDVYIASTAGDTAAGLERVVLPRLRRLTLSIGGALLSMRRVLQYVELPANATLRVVGSQAFHALSRLQPFPTLALSKGLDRLSVDIFPRGIPGAGVVIRACGPPTGDGEGAAPGLLLDLPTYRGTWQEADALERIVRSLVPYEKLVEVSYRIHRSRVTPMQFLLREHDRLPALRTFRYVDVDRPSPGAGPMTGADGEGAKKDILTAFVASLLGDSAGLEELEIWTGDAGLPYGVLAALEAQSPDVVRSLRRLTIRVPLSDGGLDVERGQPPTICEEAFLREHVEDVSVFTETYAPSMNIGGGAGGDLVECPYGW